MNRRGRAARTVAATTRAVVATTLAVALAGCDLARDLLPESPREPLEQAFRPEFPPEPPAGDRMHVETATLSPDRWTLTITFTGSKGYLASDPCSEDYLPWVGLVGTELGVTVIRVRYPGDAELAPNQGCTLEGYGYTFHLRLPRPWNGQVVRDLDTGMELIDEP